MSAIELIPLPGYQASDVVDIANVNGQTYIVGKSYEPLQPFWAPQTYATLWRAGQIIYLSKTPGPPILNPDASEGIRVNAKGDVLCVEHGSSDVYYIWQNESVPAIDLGTEINGLKQAIDLNDNRQLLVELQGGEWAVEDLNTGQPTILPPFPILQPYHFPYDAFGIDNKGRVAALSFTTTLRSGEEPTEGQIAYWTPGAQNWKVLYGPVGGAVLTRSGLILVTGEFESQAYYYDLNSPGTPRVNIPFLSPTDRIAFYLDANSEGWIVGGEGQTGGPSSDITPTLYNEGQSTPTGLANYFDPFWKNPIYAAGIVDMKIIGKGIRSGQTRGWILDLTSQKHISFKWIPSAPYHAAIDWRSVYFPWINLPDPPIEGLRQLIQAMKPEERKRLLALVRQHAAYYTNLENAIQEAGLRRKGNKE